MLHSWKIQASAKHLAAPYRASPKMVPPTIPDTPAPTRPSHPIPLAACVSVPSVLARGMGIPMEKFDSSRLTSSAQRGKNATHAVTRHATTVRSPVLGPPPRGGPRFTVRGPEKTPKKLTPRRLALKPINSLHVFTKKAAVKSGSPPNPLCSKSLRRPTSNSAKD